MASSPTRMFDIIKEAGASEGSLSFPGTPAFLDLLNSLVSPTNGIEGVDKDELSAARGLFDWETFDNDIDDNGAGIVVGRAPGRLDVMGGIADYSGSLVLQLPLAEACHTAAQLLPLLEGNSRAPELRVVSFGGHEGHRSSAFVLPMADLFGGDLASGRFLALERVRAVVLSRDPEARWAAYPVGCLAALATEHPEAIEPLRKQSLSLLIHSHVPEGKGVSSSAALEVACTRALAALLGLPGLLADGRQLALLCQRAENRAVGAPCGVMDQMAACLGRAGQLLALLCQPCTLRQGVTLPPHLSFWGIDSGERHSVGGSDYGAVRTGAFMGLKILRGLSVDASSFPLTSLRTGLGEMAAAGGGGNATKASEEASQDLESTTITTTAWPGCLAEVTPSQWAGGLAARCPEMLTGADFLSTHGPHIDTVTVIDAGKSYAVRGPTAHPIGEHLRVRAFAQAMAAPAGEEQLSLLGELMRGSHASYGAIGLGSQGTDRIVALVEQERVWGGSARDVLGLNVDAPDDSTASSDPMRAPPSPLYGAKITGGGSGGVVCVLAAAGPAGEAAVRRVAEKYAAERGWPAPAQVFGGSSDGAQSFGILRLKVRK